jgi:hypothetical protein
VGGDSTAKRREIAFDAPLRRALAIMARGNSQKDLFRLAASEKEQGVKQVPATQTAAARP